MPLYKQTGSPYQSAMEGIRGAAGTAASMQKETRKSDSSQERTLGGAIKSGVGGALGGIGIAKSFGADPAGLARYVGEGLGLVAPKTAAEAGTTAVTALGQPLAQQAAGVAGETLIREGIALAPSLVEGAGLVGGPLAAEAGGALVGGPLAAEAGGALMGGALMGEAGTAAGAAGGALAGAETGAMLGMSGGAVGAAVGAGLGLAFGLATYYM